MKTLYVNGYLVTRPKAILRGKTFKPEDKIEEAYVVTKDQLLDLVGMARAPYSLDTDKFLFSKGVEVISSWESLFDMGWEKE